MFWMTGVLAGLLAALGAYLFNRRVVAPLGTDGVAYVVPLVEEGLKTGLALFWGGSLVLAHLAFGVAEGLYDLKTSPRGLGPAVVGVASHLLFGAAAYALWAYSQSIWLAWLGGVLLHMSWNFLVVKVLPFD